MLGGWGRVPPQCYFSECLVLSPWLDWKGLGEKLHAGEPHTTTVSLLPGSPAHTMPSVVFPGTTPVQGGQKGSPPVGWCPLLPHPPPPPSSPGLPLLPNTYRSKRGLFTCRTGKTGEKASGKAGYSDANNVIMSPFSLCLSFSLSPQLVFGYLGKLASSFPCNPNRFYVLDMV